jgi:hypothetical protein
MTFSTSKCFSILGGTSSRWGKTFLASACAMSLFPAVLFSEGIAVRQREGVGHGFLAFRNPEGHLLAVVEQSQTVHGDRVDIQLRFRFKDGSIYEEITSFSQGQTFRLLKNHVVEKGPAFEHPMESWVDTASREVKVQYTDDKGKEKVVSEVMDLPTDLANGMVSILLKNLDPDVPRATVPMLAMGPKPRVVKLVITSQGEDAFSVGGFAHKAKHYVINVEIGGVAGVVAPLTGKQPPPRHFWIYGREVPTMVKFEGPLCEDCPVGQLVPTGPNWPSDRRSGS